MNSNKQIVLALRAALDSIPNEEHRKDERDAIERAISHYNYQSEQDDKADALQVIGESAARCLSDMVAALNCDYDRLEELKQAATEVELDSEDAEELAQLEEAAGDCTSREDAQQRIQEDPLSLQVRSGWASSKAEFEVEEFEILLSTGGPATRIIGELDEHGQASRARLQAQDWFTVWTDYRGDAISQSDLLAYCNEFYFGE